MATPNVNFFIHSVPYLEKDLGINHPLVKKYWKERQFYSCQNSAYNIIGYVEQGSEQKLDFVEYSGNNEKSKGVFDINGLCTKERIAELKNGFKNTKSHIWHGLITFEELFGKKYCNDYEKAYELVKSEFPKFLKRAGFDKNNIEWFAGFHENTDNRHIHFAFYEKVPQRNKANENKKSFSQGMVSISSIKKMKLYCEQHLTESKEHKLPKVRQHLTTEFLDAISKKPIKGEFGRKMKEIILLLPTTGRVSYDSENMLFMRNKINYLVDLMIKQDKKVNATYQTFLSFLLEKDESIKRMCVEYKINPDKVVLFDKYRNDMYRRLGNIVIKDVFAIRSQLRQMDYNTKSRLVKKRIQHRKDAYALEQSMYLADKVQYEAMSYFQEHMKVLEEMKIKVLIEQGIIQL